MAIELRNDVWTIERLVPGGEGFARLPDGRAAFAAGAFPGDRVRPLRSESRKGYVRALEWQLVDSSPQRVRPACAFAQSCGGCDWIELEPSAQLEHKAGLLREALVRTGGFHDLASPLPIVASASILAYRNRLRLHIDEAGRIGLYGRASHALVEIGACAVSDSRINDVIARLRELVHELPGGLAELSEVEIRVSPLEPRPALYFTPRRGQAAVTSSTRRMLALLRERYVVSVARARSERPVEVAAQRFPLPGRAELRVPVSSFVQVNWAVNEALIGRLLELAEKHDVRRFIELYAGAGNFTIPLLERGLSGVAIEGNGEAAGALEQAALAYRGRLRVLAGDVRQQLAHLPRAQKEQLDCVILDPPRTGARDVLADVLALAPHHIAVCACDPVTLARDLRSLCQAGYVLRHVEAFDMFPNTHHVEALAWLTRAGP